MTVQRAALQEFAEVNGQFVQTGSRLAMMFHVVDECYRKRFIVILRGLV